MSWILLSIIIMFILSGLSPKLTIYRNAIMSYENSLRYMFPFIYSFELIFIIYPELRMSIDFNQFGLLQVINIIYTLCLFFIIYKKIDINIHITNFDDFVFWVGGEEPLRFFSKTMGFPNPEKLPEVFQSGNVAIKYSYNKFPLHVLLSYALLIWPYFAQFNNRNDVILDAVVSLIVVGVVHYSVLNNRVVTKKVINFTSNIPHEDFEEGDELCQTNQEK